MRDSLRRGCCAVALAVAAALMTLATAQSQTVGRDQVYLDADELEEDRDRGLYIARGGVRLSSGTRVVTADELEYEPSSGRVTARGHVRIYEGDAPAQLADEVLLDDRMGEGVAYGFATLLENNGRAAAAAAIRRSDGSVELSDAYYTACDLCEDGGDPTWRLRARRVVRDLDDDMIYYSNAQLEIGGVPVLYSPVFAHADPSAERKSGLLLPKVDISNRLGAVYQQPYLWVISPFQDLTVAPRLMTERAPLLAYDYRKRFYSGQFAIEGSVTYAQEFDKDGEFGPEQLRGHVFAEGLFAFSDIWRWGFGLQAASEDTYLRRYDFNEAPEESAALFEFRDQFLLVNQLFVVGKGDHFYADVSALSADLLQDGFDDDRLPLMAPFIRFAADAELPWGLGDFDVFANSVFLRRELGDDYGRASLGASWSRPVTLPGGVRLEGFAEGRIDSYATTRADGNGQAVEDQAFTRARGAVGLDISYPFVRRGGDYDVIIAPRTALIASNGGDPAERPLSAELTDVDFSRRMLFDPVRSPGFDVFEDGVRVDAGLELELIGRSSPFTAEAFVGRSFKLEGEERFGPSTGIAEDQSDWVADVDIDFGAFGAFASTRLDSETGRLNRVDAEARAEFGRAMFGLGYTRLDDEASPAGFEEVTIEAKAAINRRWSAFYEARWDLELSEDRRQQAGLIYSDECTLFRVYFQRENIDFGNLGPSESLKFDLVLFTLGGVADQ